MFVCVGGESEVMMKGDRESEREGAREGEKKLDI